MTNILSIDRDRIRRVRYISFKYQVYQSDASRIPNDQLIRLGWILSSVDMESLNSFRMNDPDVLAALGTTDRLISVEKVVETIILPSYSTLLRETW